MLERFRNPLEHMYKLTSLLFICLGCGLPCSARGEPHRDSTTLLVPRFLCCAFGTKTRRTFADYATYATHCYDWPTLYKFVVFARRMRYDMPNAMLAMGRLNCVSTEQ